MRHAFLTGFLALVGAVTARGDLVVSIVNLPAEVHDLDPVYVLYAVENRGNEPVYLPAEHGYPGWGVSVLLGPAGQELRPLRMALGDRLTSFPVWGMWLAPSERWLFYEPIGRGMQGLEGEIHVQAVLSSMGKCGDEQVYGRKSFPLNSLRIGTFQPKGSVWSCGVIRCWEGEVRSETRSVWVRRFTDPVDLEAIAYVRNESSRPKAGDESVRGSRTWPRGLDTFFRESRYTFAYLSRSGSGIHTWLQALELQPDHPLAPWVRSAVAMRALDHESSCWDQKKLPFDFDRSGRQPPSYEPSKLPAGVPEFLDQYRWYLENRHCPRVLREAKKGGRE